MFKEIGTGFSTYFQAFGFIQTHGLWKYIIVPALINLLLFIGASVLVWNYTGLLSNWLIDLTGVDTVAGTTGSVLEWVVTALIKLISFFIYFKLYRYAVLFLSAPALALIAEKTQEILTGISHPLQAGQLLKDVVRGLGITLKNLIKELAFTLPLYLLSLVPLLTPFTTLAILLIESYFVGFSMIDYRNEFRRLSARESNYIIKKHRGLAIGNGLAFNLLLLIPLLGVLLAPPLGAVAAGIAANQVLDKEPNLR
jgi:CysZ protein